MWFMETFRDGDELIDVNKVRKSLGDFKKVIQYPALYGARISQAFTTTDPGVKVLAEEVIIIDDLEFNGSNFTDGTPDICFCCDLDIDSVFRCWPDIIAASA